MTKKDYVLIAGAIRETISFFDFHQQEQTTGVEQTMIRIEIALKKENPKFDIEKFENYIYTGKAV